MPKIKNELFRALDHAGILASEAREALKRALFKGIGTTASAVYFLKKGRKID